MKAQFRKGNVVKIRESMRHIWWQPKFQGLVIKQVCKPNSLGVPLYRLVDQGNSRYAETWFEADGQNGGAQ